MRLIRVLLASAGLVLFVAAPAVAQEAQPDPSTEEAAADPVPHKTCYDVNGFPFQTYVEFEPCQTEPTGPPEVVTCYVVVEGVTYTVETGKAEAEATGCNTEPNITPDVPGAFALASYTYEEEEPEVPDVEELCGAPDWTEEQRDAFRAAILALVAQGHDFGAPPCGVIEECSVGIDPPEDIEVTLVVDGVLIGSAVYDGATPNHLANFNLEGKVFGTKDIVAEATWNIGTGTLVLEGEVNCPEAPPETTTTTTQPAPTTTVAPPGPPAQAAPPATPTSTPSGTLPHTGIDSGTAALAGLVALLSGAGAVWRYRQRRTAGTLG